MKRTMYGAFGLVMMLAWGTLAQAEDWLGQWQVTSTRGIPYVITLSPQGKAVSSLEEGIEGSWEEKDGMAFVTLASGWRAILTHDAKGYSKAAFAPGKDFSDNPDSVLPISRLR